MDDQPRRTALRVHPCLSARGLFARARGRHPVKTRAVILYWLILLAATIAAGALMVRLLGRERQQIAATRIGSLEARARVIADDLTLTVEDAKDTLLDAVAALPPDARATALRQMELGNPLVRNVFVWSGERGLLLPDASHGLSTEEDGFVRRYHRLFSGQQSWPAAAAPDAPAGDADALSIRQAMRSLARRAAPESARPDRGEKGWLSWFWEDQLYLLGWVRDPANDLYYGLELEMPALLARLAVAVPDAPPDFVFGMLDGNGNLFAQRGAAEITGKSRPLAIATLGPALPHWSIAIYETLVGAQAGSTALGLAGGATVATLLLAILSAGSLLLWQARRSVLEARQRTSFVANVSHELKTPLTTIRMYTEMLAEGRVTDGAKRAHYLDVVARESVRLTRLVNNVLDFSRLEQGRKQYRRERLDLAALTRDVLASQADRLRESGLQLQSALPDPAAWVEADSDAVAQALLNLMDNAVKYAASGGRLDVALRRMGSRWRLSVEDAGPGIPAEHRPRLFEKFHRVDDSLGARVPGFGLGLSISRRLVEDQGGTLTYEPAPGGGARFVMSLPAHTGDTAPAPAGAP